MGYSSINCCSFDRYNLCLNGGVVQMANISLSQLSNQSSFSYYGEIVNTATDGLFWTIILLAIFIIILINSLKYGIERAILSSCFTALIFSLFLVNISWISFWWSILFGLGVAGSLLYIYYNNSWLL